MFSFFRSHKTLYMFIFNFFRIHNGRLAVISLFTDRQIRIRHIPQCNFLLSKEMISTSLKKKKTHHQCTATKMKKVPKNNKTICTSLL